ncbi:MAG: hypothetical protein U1F43_34540 [Myxococcota bacterium]
MGNGFGTKIGLNVNMHAESATDGTLGFAFAHTAAGTALGIDAIVIYIDRALAALPTRRPSPTTAEAATRTRRGIFVRHQRLLLRHRVPDRSPRTTRL